MSDDIVERLFNWQDDTVVMEIRQTAEDIQKLMAEASDEIERLRARLAEAERERDAAWSVARAHEVTMDGLRARLAEAEREVKDSREAEDYAKTVWHEAEARLAEAEALLREARDYPHKLDSAHSTLRPRIDAFLGPADSAPTP